MEIGVNKVILIGRSGADADIKHIASGTVVANFSLAINESFRKGDGEQRDRVQWVRCVAWGKLAEVCGQYLTKGKQVYIEGSIKSRQWEDQSGNKRTSYDIVARQMTMLGSRSDSDHASGSGSRPSAATSVNHDDNMSSQEPPSSPPDITDEDIPF